jgi:hypothetical protein
VGREITSAAVGAEEEAEIIVEIAMKRRVNQGKQLVMMSPSMISAPL